MRINNFKTSRRFHFTPSLALAGPRETDVHLAVTDIYLGSGRARLQKRGDNKLNEF